MEFKEYRKQASRTLAPLSETYGINIIEQAFDDIAFHFDDKTSQAWNDLAFQLDQSHMIQGMFSEIEELIVAIKRRDKVNIKEELGDITWYIANFININYPEFDDEMVDFLPLNVSMNEQEILLMLTQKVSALSDFTKRELAYRQFKINNANKVNVYTIEVLRWVYHIARKFEITPEKMYDRNIAKLYVRYPNKFNQEDATIRNLEAELKELEK